MRAERIDFVNSREAEILTDLRKICHNVLLGDQFLVGTFVFFGLFVALRLDRKSVV